MDEYTLNVANLKMDAIIVFLKENGGYDYEMNNISGDVPDSNIVEYAEDIKELIIDLRMR